MKPAFGVLRSTVTTHTTAPFTMNTSTCSGTTWTSLSAYRFVVFAMPLILQVPITLKAKKEHTTPQAIVDRYHNIIKDSFEKLGISFDIYSRTSGAEHHKTASEFFTKLYNDGSLPIVSLVLPTEYQEAPL